MDQRSKHPDPKFDNQQSEEDKIPQDEDVAPEGMKGGSTDGDQAASFDPTVLDRYYSDSDTPIKKHKKGGAKR